MRDIKEKATHSNGESIHPCFLFTSPLVTPPAVWRLGFVCLGTRDIAMQQQRMAEVAVQTGPTLDPLPSKN